MNIQPSLTYDCISFRIGEKRFFLHSGEIHHFRTNPEQWQDSLEKVRQANLNAISLYVPWNWHETEEGNLDFTGRTDPRRNLVRFLELAQSLNLYIILRPGPFICSEWLNGGIPSWLLEKHPEILALDSQGQTCESRGMIYPPITYNHPTYLQYVQKWLHDVIEVARPYLYNNGGRIINIQLDDEQSYWRTLEQGPTFADYSPVVIGGKGYPNRYGLWLSQKYASNLDRLNVAHKASYPEFSAAQPPFQLLESAELLPAYLDWYWFKLSEIDIYIKNLYDIVRAEGVTETISTLCHYLFTPMAWPKFTRFLLENKLDIILTNQYYSAPLFEISDMREDKLGSIAANMEIYKAALKHTNIPPILMEIQSAMCAHLAAPEMEELYRLVIAQGTKGLNYYMIAGGENPPEFVLSNGRSYDISAPIGYQGETRPHYGEIQAVGQILQTFEQRLLETNTLTDTCIGFYEPYEACMHQGDLLNLGFRDDYRTLINEYFNYFICRPRGLDFFTLLTHSGVSFEMEDLESITSEELSQKPSLWVLGLDFMAREVQEKLASFVLEGGTLIMFPRVPILDEYMNSCTILADLFDAPPLNPQPARQLSQPPWFRSFNFDSRKGVLAFDYMDVFQPPADADILAVENRTNQPCAFMRRVGKGQAVLIGFKLRYVWDAHGDHKAFILHILNTCNIKRHAYSESNELVVKENLGNGYGFLTIVNPVNIPNASKIHYTDPLTRKEAYLPMLDETLMFTRQGGITLVLDLPIPGTHFSIVHATAEILEIRKNENATEIVLRNSGVKNTEIAIQTNWQIKVKVDAIEIVGKRIADETMCYPISFVEQHCTLTLLEIKE